MDQTVRVYWLKFLASICLFCEFCRGQKEWPAQCRSWSKKNWGCENSSFSWPWQFHVDWWPLIALLCTAPPLRCAIYQQLIRDRFFWIPWIPWKATEKDPHETCCPAVKCTFFWSLDNSWIILAGSHWNGENSADFRHRKSKDWLLSHPQKYHHKWVGLGLVKNLAL